MNRWNSKRIAFVSILIAMSISFVIIGAQAAALSSLPSFKLSLAGLPIKIVGYLFGPITGFLTGFITDLLSFLFIPAFYYPVYSVALGVSGAFPGLIAIFFNYCYERLSKENVIKSLKTKQIIIKHEIHLLDFGNENNPKMVEKLNKKLDKIENKISKLNLSNQEKYQMDFAFYFGMAIILILMICITTIIILVISQEEINNYFADKGVLKLFSNKSLFSGIIWVGLGTSLILLLICRFKMKPQNFLTFTPILIFVILTEYVNLPIIAFADEHTINVTFIASFIASLIMSPIKIWFNLIIINFAIKITLPLIRKKTFNGYI